MSTVLGQEVIRYNRLLKVITTTLRDLCKAIKGLVVMSVELDSMANCLYDSIIDNTAVEDDKTFAQQ